MSHNNNHKKMETELLGLEKKVAQLVQRCAELREQNLTLRQKVLRLEQENDQFKQKLNHAHDRIAAIIAKLPEEISP